MKTNEREEENRGGKANRKIVKTCREDRSQIKLNLTEKTTTAGKQSISHEIKMNPYSPIPSSSPHLFSVSGCWTESSSPDSPPRLGHTRLVKYISSKIYTHVRNPGRVGLTPEHNVNQLFSCSRIFNQSIATTIGDREKNSKQKKWWCNCILDLT